MKLVSVILVGTTAGGGSVTVTDTKSRTGLLYAAEWIDGTLADGVDATLTVQNTESGVVTTLLTLTNANDDAWYHVRHLVHDETGTALTGTAGGDRVMPVINGTLQLAITSGGATNTGGCIVYYFPAAEC